MMMRTVCAMTHQGQKPKGGFDNRPDIWQQPVPEIEIWRLANGEETIYGFRNAHLPEVTLDLVPMHCFIHPTR